MGYCWNGLRTFAPNTDFSNFGDINNCYTSGTVTSGVNGYAIGGLLGGFGSDINNCYSTCKVTAGKNSDVGGLAGINYCSTKNSYFLLGSGPNNGIGLPLTDSQMKHQASFVGWDFAGESANGTDDIWMIFDGVDYPKLAWIFDSNCPIAGRK